ncbi:MAG: hypothetical protein LBQ14_10035 [Treponema sp.]|jgi:hypothetical protein|nr:hypothetical protein [Treponema sp.]
MKPPPGRAGRLFRPFLLILALMIRIDAAAQEKNYSLGGGFEGSYRFVRGPAAGGSFSFDYRIKESTAAGVKLTSSYNITDGSLSLEPEGLVRWYYFTPEWAEFFAQFDLGTGFVVKNARAETVFFAGLTMGIRFPIKKRYYLEPYIEAGYPFLLAGGILAGRRF